jgi:hypothetical protein
MNDADRRRCDRTQTRRAFRTPSGLALSAHPTSRDRAIALTRVANPGAALTLHVEGTGLCSRADRADLLACWRPIDNWSTR